MKRLRMIPLMFALIPLAACAYWGGPIEGRVLEEGTDKPISGAIVVVRWQGTAFSFVESPTVCIHVETTTTDKDGRYRIPFWHASAEPPGVHGIEPIVTAYKAGYQWPTRLPKSLGGGDQYLAPFRETREERLQFIQHISSATGCTNAGNSIKNTLPFAEAIYQEALQLAESKEDKQLLDYLLSDVEVARYGYEEAQKRQLERAGGSK